MDISARLPGMAVEAKSGLEPGLARLDTTGGPQAPVFLPAAASVFPLPDMLIFHRPFQKLSQGLGQAVGGGELRPGCPTFQQPSSPSRLSGASHPMHPGV